MTVETLPLNSTYDQTPDQLKRTAVLRKVLREPLTHFLALGGALFLFNALISPAVPADRKIEITPEVRQSIAETFKAERRRDPSPQELDYLLNTWILNEITYREAVAQGLDKGDEMIRERLMQKMRVLIFTNLRIETPTEIELQHWLDTNRSQFDVPELVSFSGLVFTGPDARAEADSLRADLNAGRTPDIVRLRMHPFGDRPRQSLEATFGKDFVAALVKQTPNEWHVLENAEGWHVVRLDHITPGRQVALEEVRDKVAVDWKEANGRARAVQTVRDMGKNYKIEGLAAR